VITTSPPAARRVAGSHGIVTALALLALGGLAVVQSCRLNMDQHQLEAERAGVRRLANSVSDMAILASECQRQLEEEAPHEAL